MKRENMAITLCSETVATHHNLRAMSHSLAYVDAELFLSTIVDK
jgi:hypothetical protein